MTVTAVLGGVTYTMTYNSVSGCYEAAVTAPAATETAVVTVTSNGVEYTASAECAVISPPTIYDADIYLLDSSFAVCGIIDRYTSFSLKRRYYGAGSFSLTLPTSYFSDISAAVYLYHLGADVCCVIENICFKKRGGGGLSAGGRTLERLFSRRIVTAANLSGRVETSARSLITTYALTGAKAFAGLALDGANGYTDTAEFTLDIDTLDSALTRLLRQSEMGWYVKYHIAAKTLRCGIYRGADRSGLIFSTSFGNLRTTEYYRDTSECANYFYIENGGTVTEINLAGSDVRREAYIDADDITGLEGTALTAALTARAYEAANQRKAVEALTGTADIGEPIYGVDYKLGDTVTMRDDDIGVSIQKRVTEIDEVWEASEPTIYPTFGDVADVSIKKLIKQKGII